MKKLILIFFPFLFVSCSVKHKKTFDYIFNKTEAITLEQSKLTLSKDITVLSFSDSSICHRTLLNSSLNSSATTEGFKFSSKDSISLFSHIYPKQYNLLSLDKY